MGFFNSPKVEQQLSVALEGDKPQESLPPPQKVSSTLITQGVTIKGTVEGEGVVQVEGEVEGEFHMVGAVIVADTGLVRGPISADVVRVAGKVEGNVTAREHMRLEQTGTLIGDVATASLVVEDGGRLNGRSTMTNAPDPDPELRDVRPVDDLQFGPDYPMEGDI
jgi:cytoskeletal protein CcmA (bactofilin family)